MLGLDNRGQRWRNCLLFVGVISAILLFAGILTVNVAGQGYQQRPFRSSSYNVSYPSFPANFLRGSLKDQSSCDQQPIRVGDGITNSSMLGF